MATLQILVSFTWLPKTHWGVLQRHLTFRFNIISSLLKLLCILARICEGTLLQPLRLDFILHLLSTLRIEFFCRYDNITRGKSQHPSACPTNQPPRYRDIPPLPTYHYNPPRKVSHHSAFPSATGGRPHWPCLHLPRFRTSCLLCPPCNRLSCVSQNHVSMHLHFYSFFIESLGEVGEEYLRGGGGWGGGALVLIPTGGRSRNKKGNGDGPTATDPCCRYTLNHLPMSRWTKGLLGWVKIKPNSLG